MIINLMNLKRSVDRLRAFSEVNRHLLDSVIRFSAIDGSQQDMAALVRQGLITAGVAGTYRKGALGNALSQLVLWEKAVASRKVQTICEDDAILHRGFIPCAERIISVLPRDWDIVLWGWNFDGILLFHIPGLTYCRAQFDQNELRKSIGCFQAMVISPQPFRLLGAFGTLCYSVSPKGAEALKRHCFPIHEKPIFLPGLNRSLPYMSIDIAMNEVYPRLSAFASFPPLAVTENDHQRSTIQNRP
jgi:GR25 family glycosyltransferase involved in LPS biosynthesis